MKSICLMKIKVPARFVSDENKMACSPARFVSAKGFLCDFIQKYFAVFDQSDRAIYLTWYQSILFFREFSSIIPFTV